MPDPANKHSLHLRYRVHAAALLFACFAGSGAFAAPRHALAMHGEPLYGPDFTHFRYANPEAPKGGRLTIAAVGTFDSINPFVIRGNPFQKVRNYVVEGLMARGQDEPFTVYPLIAKTIETDDERRFVAFTLDERARFSDGQPVTAEDVLFSWQLLRDKGRPNHRLYYSKVVKAEKTGPHAVRFDFADDGDRELPLIMAMMPVLPKHATDAEKFGEPSLAPMLGSGPYTIEEIRSGEHVLLRRNAAYWGRDLPANRGHYNFDELRFEFYREAVTWLEAFRRKQFDFLIEDDPSRWALEYDFPAAKSDGLIREEIGSEAPKPIPALVFNTRRAIFVDARVREALIELFDFEWVNAKLFHSAFRRSGSFFDDSKLSARGEPPNEKERELLAPFLSELRPDVLEGKYEPPVSDGSGRDLQRLRRALQLLRQAGWTTKDNRLVHRATGAPFRFEILVTGREDERLVNVYASMLARAGITADVRRVDGSQFEQRRTQFDFDMAPAVWSQSLSPGNEQFFYFGSASADQPGTRNYMGMKSKAADAMIEATLRARTPQELRDAARALDRVLMSGNYFVPLYYLPKTRIARWPHIERPGTTSLYGVLPDTWWRKAGAR